MEAYFRLLEFFTDFISIYQKENEVIIIRPDDLEIAGYFIATYVKIDEKILFYAVLIKAKRSTLTEFTLLYDPAKTIEVDRIIGCSLSNRGLCITFTDFKKSVPKTIGIEEKLEKIKDYIIQLTHTNNPIREHLLAELHFGVERPGGHDLSGGLPSLGKKR